MSTTINPGYGFRIIDTSTEPPMDGDEFFESGDWIESSAYPSGKRAENTAYRRKIDVGAGCELVPETEIETLEMEFTYDGKSWRGKPLSNPPLAISVYTHRFGPIAFRRKIHAPRESFVVIDDSLTHFFPTENEACERAIERCRLSARRWRVAKITRSFSPETTVTVKETTP